MIEERTASNVNKIIITKNTVLSDITFSTLFDTVYFDMYEMSPTLHSHSHYEIHIGIEGEYCIGLEDGSLYEIRRDTLCLIPAKCYHCSKSSHNDQQKIAFRFSYKHNKMRTKSSLYDIFNRKLFELKKPIVLVTPELCGLIRTIHDELKKDDQMSGVMTELLTGEFYIRLLRLIDMSEAKEPETVRTVDDNRSIRAFKIEMYLSEYYPQQITELDLARVLKLSKRQTSREMQLIFGMSFHEKLTSVRMIKAAELLLKDGSNIKTTAHMVGYVSVPGFYTMFNKYYGMTPLNYINTHKN